MIGTDGSRDHQKPMREIDEHVIDTYFTFRVNYYATEESK